MNGIGNPDSVPWAARNAVNVVGNVPARLMRGITDRYRAEWAALGHTAETLPKMGVTRHVVVAETEQEALEIARPAYRKWRESFMLLWLKHGSALPNPNALPSEEFEEAERLGRAVAGTADKVQALLRASIDEGGLNYLLCRFFFGDMQRDAALRSVRLFAREVMPAFA